MLLLALAACIENALDKGEPAPFDSGAPVDTAADSDPPPPPAEACNGVDDDGDGLVDEGFGDVDGDGAADCVDDACVVTLAAPRSEADPDCADPGVSVVPPTEPWAFVTTWRNNLGAVEATPAVGDLDGDGKPEVVAPFRNHPYVYTGDLLVIDGGSGRERLRLPAVDVTSGTALADLDGDGRGEIVALFAPTACVGSSEVRAYDATGGLLWAQPGSWSCETYPAVGDLDGDGAVEVVANEWVLDGATGAPLAQLPLTRGEYEMPVLADMDADGAPEILVADRVYAADGSVVGGCGDDPFSSPHPVNVDADPEGEILLSGYQVLKLCDDDGTELWAMPHDTLAAPIALVDVDGDGVQEALFPNESVLTLLDLDGTKRWEVPVIDPSCCAGAVTWDLDLDGLPEVVYADQENLYVFDGRTGAERLRDESHDSETLFETPVVADVNGDGHGDLLFGSSRDAPGLTLLSNDQAPWAPAVYHQHAYQPEGVGEDLSIPRVVPPPWASPSRVLRGQPSARLFGGDLELDVSITEVCAASCEPDGRGSVAVQVWNAGAADVPPGVRVEVWGEVDGADALLASDTLADPLPAAASAERALEVPAAGLRGPIEARVFPPDGLDTCDPTDDGSVWSEGVCG